MRKKTWILASLSALLMATSVDLASADTLREALAKAYANSQTLNAARAQLRATDENVPQARAGLRPTVRGVATAQGSRSRTSFGDSWNPSLATRNARTGALSTGIQINQTLFDGFQTPNNVNAAQAQVRAAQKNLDNTVQDTLLNTVTVFMNVRRDREVAAFRRQSLAFLNEQVRAAQARFDVGEGTRTDVAQAQAQQALATALLNTALSQVASSEAQYLDVVGDPPGNLESGTPPNRNAIPSSVAEAIRVSQEQHPAIQATKFAVDAASFQVKSAEGQRLPTVSLTGQVDNTYAMSDQDPNNLPGVDVQTSNEVSGTVTAQLSVPIYQGGLVSSRVRQAKETLSERRIEVDNVRDQVRSAVASAWAQRQAAEANVQGYRAQVAAAQLALNGVVEERNVGQRTTLDVLNAQSDVITAQILLAGAQRDTIVASYTLASAVGSLLPERLALAVDRYEPEEHYQAVQDKWFGLRTPDGR